MNIHSFACKCGCGYNNVSSEFVERVLKAQQRVNTPILIVEGCRCRKYNKLLSSSFAGHINGTAANITVKKHYMSDLINACYDLFEQIGIYEKYVYVEMDSSKPKSIWIA